VQDEDGGEDKARLVRVEAVSHFINQLVQQLKYAIGCEMG